MEKPRTVQQLSEFNDLLTCRICQGYMIDPTTFDCCSHTFCRSCILKHLLRDVHCPQCKASGGGGKHISEDNLRSDDTLRALIYKLVPGIYQRECQRLVEFEREHGFCDDEEVLQEFFAPAEPISLSLEYHPAMLKNCSAADKPQVYYLQCPAGLRVGHLRRFLCSKYDIDAESRQVEVEVTYEDEVLPQNFTLMDVGYCYKWERHAPMAFRYRILLFDGEEEQRIKNDENNLSKINKDNAIVPHKVSKSVTFADDVVELPSKTHGKLSKSSKRATGGGGKREDNNGYTLSNFKSLRSNDMRYSDYAVSSTTAANQVRVKCEPEEQQQAAPPVTNSTNMMSMVSIPQSQLSKAVNFEDELSYELKTANKKNQLKLKIELNNLKVRPSVPKSAEPRLETVAIQQQLDLETYAKNIGLKPIEPSLKLSAAAAPSNGATVDASNSSSSSSSSSHRKRKKKHSKEPKDANGKRKKLHAEISSQTDGKMKMKITTTPHNHKSHKLELKRAHSLAGGELLQLQQQLEQQLEKTQALNKTLGEESRSINNLMPVAAAATAATPTPLPASAPLPPSLFKTFASTGSNTTKPKPAPPQLLPKPPKPALNNNNITNNNNNNNNRKPVLPITPHFVVPQAPLRQAPTYQLQRYASTPSSIASSANKQPKRALSLDETQQQQQLQKQPRLDLQQQQQRLAKLKPAVYAPQQTRCYGPELAPKPAPRQLCPASLASLSQSRPRLPAAISYAPMPSLEIVRLTAAAVAAAAATRLMGPPVAPAKRASASIAALPLPVPTMVKSPPLSIALAAQRQHSNSNNSNSSNVAAAYRTSPPALINLRNNAPLAFASKSAAAKAELNSKKPATVAGTAGAATATTTAATAAAAASQSKANGTAALLDKSKTSLRDFRPAVTAATTTTTTTAAAAAATVTATTTTATKDADILDLSAAAARSSSKATATTTATTTTSSKLAPITNTAAAATATTTTTVSSSNSLEAALNKIKQNINANSSSSSSTAATTASDNLENLHLLSESATAREKISIKLSNIYENKSKNALVRPQNASVRSIPNPSALAFRNQVCSSSSSSSTTTAAATTVAASSTAAAAAATTVTAAAVAAVKPLAIKADEKSKLTAAPMLLSPNSSNNNNNSSSNNNNNNAAATSPRAIKKATTIDQVAANLNIRAEAKAAALAEPAPAAASGNTAEKPNSSKTEVSKESTAAAAATNVATTSSVATATPTPVAAPVSVPLLSLPSAAAAAAANVTESMSKPPVQIAATDTLAPVASSA